MQQISPFLLSLLAGLSTGIGGVFGVAIVNIWPAQRTLAICSGFAGGVMLTISLADLAPGALEFYAQYLSPFWAGAALLSLLGAGILIALVLEHTLPEETVLAERLGGEKAAALRAALVTGIALLLHNLPEGVLTLFTGVANPALGVRTALAVALHNIPEGLAVAVPLYYATGKRGLAAGAALLSGVAEPAGALCAWLFLHNLFTPGFLNGTVVLVAGIMLWVSVSQLLPAAYTGGTAQRRAGAAGIAVGCLTMLLGIAALP